MNSALYSTSKLNVTKIPVKDSKPIIAGIIDRYTSHGTQQILNKIMYTGDFVDCFGDPRKLRANQMLTSGVKTYAISNCSPTDKWSNNYYNCTGIVFVGECAVSGLELSVLTHQDPWKFLKGNNFHEAFSHHLKESIELFLEKTIFNTVDFVIFGGKYGETFGVEYRRSIETLSELCKSSSGITPIVLAGPNMCSGGTDVYLNTQHRRLYVVRKSQPRNLTNESFYPSELETKKRAWDEYWYTYFN